MTCIIHLGEIWDERQKRLFNLMGQHAKEWHEAGRCKCGEKGEVMCRHFLKDCEKMFGREAVRHLQGHSLIMEAALEYKFR